MSLVLVYSEKNWTGIKMRLSCRVRQANTKMNWADTSDLGLAKKIDHLLSSNEQELVQQF